MKCEGCPAEREKGRQGCLPLCAGCRRKRKLWQNRQSYDRRKIVKGMGRRK